QLDRLPDRLGPKALRHHCRTADTFAADRHQYIANEYTSQFRRASLRHTHNHQTARLAGGGLHPFGHEHRLKRRTEPAAVDSPIAGRLPPSPPIAPSISPTSTPASSAGPPFATLIIIRPRDWPAAACIPSGTSTG